MASALSFNLTIDVTETIEYAGATGSDPGSGQTIKLLATKRVSGTPAFTPSASMLTANVQFDGNANGVAPENLTLQGVHDIASGNESGSVSAASPDLAEYIGGTFTFDAKALLLTIHPNPAAEKAAPAKKPAQAAGVVTSP